MRKARAKRKANRPRRRPQAAKRPVCVPQARASHVWRKRVLIGLVLIALSPILARAWVHLSVRDRVYSDVSKIPHCRVAMVLGAKVRPDGSLSESLASRVRKAIALYKAGKCEKLLMSGDNRFRNYNEPARMRDYAIERGVPAKDIRLDYAGRRTYDSVYRARYIFSIRRMIVVTQSFHVDRAIFLCKHLGVDAYGLRSDAVGDTRASIREYPACLGAIVDVYLHRPRPVMGKRETI